MEERKTRDIAGILHFLTPQQMAEEIVRLDAALSSLSVQAGEPDSVVVRLKRPEGYEDVHPELVLADAHINPAFEPELVSTLPIAAQADRLHAAIMNLPCKPENMDAEPNQRLAYKMGHRDARHAAAELVAAMSSPLRIEGDGVPADGSKL